ncbi:hypothetical protein EZS27_020513 [termite gut metagenome]|uniref:Rubredoxin-like domain-containing protein n=1 Tax=termite gut metagenome TaxID=433724 RepID=A0A5J4RB78_9ZZZZ
MLKALKIQLYPNKIQITQFNQLLGCYRVVYNKCLAYKIETYAQTGGGCGLCEISKYFHGELRQNEKYSWLLGQNTKVLQQAIRQMLTAYDKFFKHLSKYPKFKSKKDTVSSCLFPLEAISKLNDYQTNRLSLANIKKVKFSTSDKYKNYLTKYKQGIKSATLTKTASGKYFLSILVQSDEVLKKPHIPNSIVGIDMGIKSFMVTSKGKTYENLHFYKDNERKIVKLQREVSRKIKGSNNRKKSRIKLARFYEKITNQKKNYLYNVVNEILNENQVIVLEDLNVKGILRNHKLSKAIQEISLSETKRIMTYKSEWYGKTVIEVDRFYPSSKLCSKCGYKYKNLNLKEREWKCPVCGEVHNRDFNASINLENEGLRIFNLQVPDRFGELTLVETVPVDDKDSVMNPLKSTQSLKQEIGSNSFVRNC